jgi:hypothetical protein
VERGAARDKTTPARRKGDEERGWRKKGIERMRMKMDNLEEEEV